MYKSDWFMVGTTTHREDGCTTRGYYDGYDEGIEAQAVNMTTNRVFV